MTTFSELRSMIGAWPRPPRVEDWRGPRGRLAAALQDAADGVIGATNVGPGDLLGLTRQVLHHEELAQGGCPPIRVPVGHPWPTAQQWREAGVETAEVPNGLQIHAVTAWRPPWIQGDLSAVDLAVSSPDGLLAGSSRISSRARRLEAIPADPFVTDLTGHTTYHTSGQREALRAALTAPPGSVVYAILPTGTGKSLVALIPGLVRRRRSTTVVVVPTVALALDQERQFHEVFLGGDFPAELAYVGERSAEEKAAMRRRLVEGTQPVVFTSPEAAVHGLDGTLYAMAGNGALHHFVIDEAHMVTAWGDSFRPEFQLLPGLRLDLLRLCDLNGHDRFRTTLMTATLTADTLEVLSALFPAASSRYVSSVFVRPEPRYLLGPCASSEERQRRLFEAVIHLPRPMILYTTTRQDAEAVAGWLRRQGVRRVASFHGGTPIDRRRSIMERWRGISVEPKVDIVVATSAFGLGVDLGEVRTVIHACIPESVDRYYQEVGRSGRDGQVSVALFMPCYAEDFSVADRISTRTLIGGPKGFGRWSAMINGAEALEDGTFRVDTGELPRYLDDDSERNRYWNLNTLTQMARAALIVLESERPPRRAEDESDEEWEVRREQVFERYRRSAVVRLKGAGSLRTVEEWTVATDAVRSRTRGHDRGNLAAVVSLARGAACWITTFRDTYVIPSHTTLGDGTPASSTPIGACIGCPHHQPTTRAIPPESPPTVVPVPPAARADPPLERALSEQLCGGSVLTVLVPTRDRAEWRRNVRDALTRCVRNGILRVVAAPGTVALEDLAQLHHRARDGFVFVDAEIGEPPSYSVPTVLVHAPERSSILPRHYYRTREGGPPRVLLVPDDARDPERTAELIANVRMPCVKIAYFLRVC
jgi:ATP-dependent DNA helicase RecQ